MGSAATPVDQASKRLPLTPEPDVDAGEPWDSARFDFIAGLLEWQSASLLKDDVGTGRKHVASAKSGSREVQHSLS